MCWWQFWALVHLRGLRCCDEKNLQFSFSVYFYFASSMIICTYTIHHTLEAELCQDLICTICCFFEQLSAGLAACWDPVSHSKWWWWWWWSQQNSIRWNIMRSRTKLPPHPRPSDKQALKMVKTSFTQNISCLVLSDAPVDWCSIFHVLSSKMLYFSCTILGTICTRNSQRVIEIWLGPSPHPSIMTNPGVFSLNDQLNKYSPTSAT